MAFKKDERHKEKEYIKEKFQNLSREDKLELISYFLDEIKSYGIRQESSNREINIPVGVFANDLLGSLEAVVKYLKEERHLKFSKIARLLNRSGKTIWTTYSNASRKMPSHFDDISKDIMIPASEFSNRSFSALEIVVGFIKNLDYSNHEAGVMLHLDDRTIWTVCHRISMKRGMKLGRK